MNFTGSGEIINCGKYNGIHSEQFKEIVIDLLNKKGKANKKINYKLRDDYLLDRDIGVNQYQYYITMEV